MRAKEIRELVKILEDSNVGELEITYWWGRKIRISKSPTPSTVASTPGQIEIVTAVKPDSGSASLKTQEADQKQTILDQKKYIEIKSPMVGTFYRAPSPEAEAYVREGDSISQGKVLCIIEAMKLMNEIEAEVSGKIHKVMVENGRPVEYNQTLFLVEPN